jgi:ATP-dependent DNA ligase
VCAWSRHGTSLTEPLLDLLAPFETLGAGWVFDGELIALDDHDGHPVQDFAAVGRAVFGRDRTACSRLQYVAFDVLAAGGDGDVQTRPWRDARRPLPTGPSATHRLETPGAPGFARASGGDGLRRQRAEA